MTETPYTQQRLKRYRGPSSEDANLTNEENYKDLVSLVNIAAQNKVKLSNGFLVFLKELMGIAQALTNINSRIEALEADSNTIAFTTESQIDNTRFDTTSFGINIVDQCTYSKEYNILTLPKVTTSSMSKLKFTNGDGTYGIPPSLETYIVPVGTSADNSSATVDTSQPYNAIVGAPGRVWERNVIAPAPNLSSGAEMYFYVRIPNDLSSNANTNAISLTPFPMMTVDILEIAYSTDPNVSLNAASTVWTVFNSTQLYYNTTSAVGNIIPGGWSGDEILDSASKMFYFDPKPISAVRFRFRQKNYTTENNKTVYSYGLSKLDIRYDKFLSVGKAIIRFDAPAGDTINSIVSLTPQIWNIPEYNITDIFSYRVIWETSFNSNIYTLTPVPSSQRVWIEVTLRESELGGTPALSGVILKYA